MLQFLSEGLRVLQITGRLRLPHQPLQLLRLFCCNKLLKSLRRQEIMIRELKSWYHRLQSHNNVSSPLLTIPAQ
jgi:hypothetical protein